MPKINIKDNEPLERALRRFKKKIEREGTLRQVKARKHYEKPSVKKRRKIREARKKKKRF
ncbi:MAG: 30S ribosomal protein S21 [Candidatus Orphnella occulta]|nr:30S ribosomal protein S21 [Candidatus Orphnella occulta]